MQSSVFHFPIRLLGRKFSVWLLFMVLNLFIQRMNGTTVQLAVIAPLLPKNRQFSIAKIRPAVDLGIELIRTRDLLPNVSINVTYADSEMNAAKTPVEAFRLMSKELHLFLGPVYDLALAPVSRYAPYWSVPIVTPGGLAHEFKYNRQDEYSTLTRMGPGFDSLSVFIWRNV